MERIRGRLRTRADFFLKIATASTAEMVTGKPRLNVD
jgi:hypothetical protein